MYICKIYTNKVCKINNQYMKSKHFISKECNMHIVL